MNALRMIWLAGVLGVVVSGCGRGPDVAVVTQSRQMMGTLAEVTAVAADEATARAAVDAAYSRLHDVNRVMSDYVADSEIGRLNALGGGQSMVVSPETFDVLRLAAEVGRASGGAFDVTCRPLVQMWKQAGKAGRLPDEAALQAVRGRIGWDKVTLDPAGRTVTKTVADVQVDVGGIAKGYALDLAAEAMLGAGATSGLIDVGGDVLAVGRSDEDKPWRVGVQHPFGQGLADVLELTDRAVATSGVQQRFTVIEGRRYSHIVDPRTGWPAAEAPSVTVIAATGAMADAWATVFSVLTVEEGRELAKTLDGVEVLWAWGSAGDVRTAETAGFGRFRRRG